MEYTFDRLALAWCRLNCFQWDSDLLGPPPEGFNDCPTEGKATFVTPPMRAIETIVPAAVIDRCWNTDFTGHMTADEWFRWYFFEKFADGRSKSNDRYHKRRSRQKY